MSDPVWDERDYVVLPNGAALVRQPHPGCPCNTHLWRVYEAPDGRCHVQCPNEDKGKRCCKVRDGWRVIGTYDTRTCRLTIHHNQ